jgi:hypothetical protein
VNAHGSAPLAPSDEKKSNYFGRHWRGSMSLGVSYWINGGLIAGIVPLIAILVVNTYVDQQGSLRLAALRYFLTLSLVLALSVWSVVGIWRSSNLHVSRGGRAFYAKLAKIMVVLGIISMVPQLVNIYIPVGKEMVVLMLGDDPLGTYQTVLSTDGKSLLVSGMLREGAAREIEKVLDSAPSVNTLVLSSGGGRLMEAKSLATIVKRRGLHTYVEDQCASACTFVFLAGSDRAATPNAQIGFHLPSIMGNSPYLAKAGFQYMAEVYREAGLPSSFIEKVSTIPPSDMWYPTQDELIAAKVVTRSSFGGETMAKFSTVRSKQELATALQGAALFAAYEKRFPGFMQKLVDDAWTAKEQGGSDAHISAAIRSVVGKYYSSLVAAADDGTVETLAVLIVDQLKAARAVSYKACLMLIRGELDLSAVLPKEYADREKAWALRALESDRKTVARRSRQVTEAALRTLWSKLPKEQLEAVANPAGYQDPPDRVCNSTITLYDTALTLPQKQKDAALEALLKSGT